MPPIGKSPELAEDFETAEDVAGSHVPIPASSAPGVRGRNAFTELMSKKAALQQHAARNSQSLYPSSGLAFPGRDGLGAYIAEPAPFPSSRVIYYNEKFVVINDMYPKSSIHLLLLPRDLEKSRLHPFVAFEDVSFLSEVQSEVRTARSLAAKELERRFGREREERFKESQATGAPTLGGSPSFTRDWNAQIMSGVHAVPSMNHLHVHILSVDRHSECLRHRKHYNSFATPFLVSIDDFPLAKDDERRHPGRAGYLDRDLLCWRCKRNFGNKFSSLKVHLDEEYERWKDE